MPLTVTEATAVNKVVLHLTGRPTATGGRVKHKDAKEALALLAESANRKLMGGADGRVVREGWRA